MADDNMINSNHTKPRYKGIIFDFLGTIAYNDPSSPIGYQLYPEVLECLEVLKQEGFILAALNNASLHRLEAFRKLGIASYFKAILVSSLIGTYKPEPKSFEITLQKMGLDKKEVIFIDDIEINVEGAKAFGLTAYKMDRNKEDKQPGSINSLRDLVKTLSE